MAFEVGGIDDVDNEIHPLIEQKVARHALIGAAPAQQAVHARKIDHRKLQPRRGGRSPALLHRDAGPVAHMLMRPGEQVEDRGLAAIGVARQSDHRQAGVCFGGNGAIRIVTRAPAAAF